MLNETGYFLLILAFTLSIVILLMRDRRWLQSCSVITAGLTACSFAILLLAFWRSDYSLELVVAHSHSQLPDAYRLAAAWGNHEGSMLLFALILTLYGAACTRTASIVTIRLLSGVNSMILLYCISVSSPFTRLADPPMEGNDLNPLLQDPLLILHPPFLYLGYIGFVVPAAMAVAALITVEDRRILAKAMQPWVLWAWAMLSIGIALGSFWAYYELGWGGWWFWDPVENASLMPWIAGTALLHTVVVQRKTGNLGNWLVLLAISSFLLSLMGTFLVRSGALTSVHTFASDPTRGLFLLAILTVIALASFGVYAWRYSVQLRTTTPLLSRFGAIIANNLLLMGMLLIVATGTLYPLLAQAFGQTGMNIGAPYFNQAMIPLVIPFVLLMLMQPCLRWQRRLSRPQLRFTPMAVAHSGFLIFLLGAALAGFLKQEKTVYLTQDQGVQLAGYDIILRGVENGEGSTYRTVRATLDVQHDGRTIAQLHPEKRFYPMRNTVTREVSLTVVRGFSDLYATLGEPKDDNQQAWAVQIQYHPWLYLVWGGWLLMAIGGLMRVWR